MSATTTTALSADLCRYCFDTLSNHFSSRHPVAPPSFGNESYPLFVTWNMLNKGHSHPTSSEDAHSEHSYALRGCIGTFSARPLHDGLAEFSLRSALKDRRFSPISEKELPHLTCGVSLLINFEDAADYLDWEIGVHGIWIEFVTEGGYKETATYLPEVMPEQGWTKIEAIDSLLRKGGYRAKITEEVRSNIKLTRYQSVKFRMTHPEYLRLRAK
ncbi:hypothetical protein CAOG_08939 [Capsaspora owczarzaki ATCC 30864]|uniref:AMMECR1 domain-containing protein n=1 Tax=Capsaspora owczarzaki (strain ATCC 30864) TaxID=595528 RepID=A0A0D2VVX1_CAPO3|nr:hypothetical protein CAOG_08939 [Capsaspora owczarzaki ATCC 30864]KJE95622.1 hypothetical protein CAOG_008939 [Capsaspora owczarzaki ATCC 30864]|eukprot:XP_011270610.1 hypothetical protein CAOG_08939 [Capsaspora owczarzaki ATCC 30864]